MMKNKLTKLVDRIKNGKKNFYRVDVRKGEHKIGILILTHNAETAVNQVILEGDYNEILKVSKVSKR